MTLPEITERLKALRQREVLQVGGRYATDLWKGVVTTGVVGSPYTDRSSITCAALYLWSGQELAERQKPES